ncbi:sigma-54-dependent transcriptional regulator [Singulisphaera sp. PoT]|uniref:sigma-54-dependent transcriptional regulator n=1 Tax=Singulisphaera sp. PoT TaxID=3411797 RepID=UPI003BF5CB08
MATPKTPLILIADDDPNVLKALKFHLESWGCRVALAIDKGQLYRELDREPASVLLLDVRFGEHDGVEVLRDLVSKSPNLVIIMMTAYGTIDSAVAAMKLGATDYLTKPPDLNRLKVLIGDAIAKATATASAAEKVRSTSKSTAGPPGTEAPKGPLIVGNGPAIQRLRTLIASVAPTDATVLILGESGTGKEVAARSIHAQSRRKDAPFIALNMAALPRELVESTLFGHEKGAFTGADQPQQGSVEAADQGTLFLDEIGEMDVGLQSKLLRFLQERTFQRVGSSKERSVDVRIIAATNRDPHEQVRKGQLREDLYYRLNVVPLILPPLRDRREDIGKLAEHFLARVAARYGRAFDGFSPEALHALSQYDWPGNIRQLENMVERLGIFSTGPIIGLDAIPPEILNPSSAPYQPISSMSTPSDSIPVASDLTPGSEGDEPLRPIDQIEKQAIEDALRRSRGNVREAARTLGLGQATVYRKIKRYGIHLG